MSLAPLLFALAVILVAAKLGGHAAARFKQPPVLGELLAGVLIGNVSAFGFAGFEGWEHLAGLELLAELGVVVLLFQVGLESTVGQMLKVGPTALAVATLGVAGPFVLGWMVSAVLLPEASTYVHLFIGATLTATSVGITARVLKDLGRSQSDEARVILGAAVIDDVQGLIILAVITGLVANAGTAAGVSVAGIAWVVLKAAGFLVGALVLGLWISPRLFGLASKLEAGGVLLATGLAFCFALAWAATAIGLAPIVGAFAAGLVLEQLHFRGFADRGEHTLEELIEPVSAFLVPVFFVVTGLRIDLTVLAQPGVLGLAAALTVAAIVGKQLCALGASRRLDRLSIGLGMVPRGEVGLIFANIGLTLTVGGVRIIDERLFAAIVIMVVVTTVITPPALTWSLNRKK
jgi:Kef-type K+ transport system membrane component KefB